MTVITLSIRVDTDRLTREMTLSQLWHSSYFFSKELALELVFSVSNPLNLSQCK